MPDSKRAAALHDAVGVTQPEPPGRGHEDDGPMNAVALSGPGADDLLHKSLTSPMRNAWLLPAVIATCAAANDMIAICHVRMPTRVVGGLQAPGLEGGACS